MLHGIPYGIKDLASFPGYPTTWGAMPLKNQYLENKAEVIKKLEEAGAVMVGLVVKQETLGIFPKAQVGLLLDPLQR